MAVDVITEIEIDRPRAEVASFAGDPDHTTDWYRNINRVAWESPKPLTAGTLLRFEASFLGRKLAYTYEVKELVEGERLVMSTSEGPFPMETSYEWHDTDHGGTRMTLRNRGEPAGFSKIGAPAMARAMRRANRQDLRKLKAILEAQTR